MYSQENRNLRLISPLGEDVLLLRSLRGQESLSSLFHFELELVSFLDDIAFADLVGQPVTIGIRMRDDTWRPINGIVSELFQGGRDVSGLTAYKMTVVPWLWLLTLTTDCRIFQDMSVQDIVSKVFDDLGFADYEFRGATGGTEPRVYCVQYRETAFNFVSRLLEEEGIHYFWAQEEGCHTLVMTDDPSQNQPCTGHAKVPYALGSSIAHLPEDAILDLRLGQRVRTGRIALTDFNFETPSTSLMVEVAAERAPEIFDYPGRFDNSGTGDGYARIRLEEQVAQELRAEGQSICRGFSPGFQFEIKDFYRSAGFEANQLLLTVYHEARDNVGAAAAEDDLDIGGGLHYKNRFVCQPHSLPFRPPRRALKPVVRGTQTAIVSGKSGEEIWTDSHGRVKVQFHWDREGKRDEKSSCWIRVSQGWAGQGWGAMFIPRMGQEVIVDFLEGDPDRPLITGRVYNGEQTPPYPLPDDQTKSTWKSNSSKGGGGFNEFRFEDKSGEEEIFLHGQKDWNTTILNNNSRSVGAAESVSVGADQSISVGANRSVSVGKNQTTTVTGSQNVTVKGEEASGGVTGGSLNITGDYKVDASNTINIQAPTFINLTCGGSSIKIEPGKITITAGDGSSLVLDANAIATSSQGSSATLTANAVLASSGGSATTLDGTATLSSSGGSAVVLTGDAAMSSSGGSSVTLNADATLAASGGGTVALDANAKVSGVTASLEGDGSSATMSPGSAEVTGPVVKLN